MYENIDSSYQDKDIEVWVEYKLIPPYHISLNTLINVVNIWGMRLLYGNTMDSRAAVAIKIEKFKYLYQSDPVIGKEYTLRGTTKFLENGKVIKIEA